MVWIVCVLSVFIIPVALIRSNIINVRYRFFLLLGIVIGVGVVMFLNQWTLQEIGLRGADFSLLSIGVHGLALLLGYGGIVMLSHGRRVDSISFPKKLVQFFFISLPIGFAQEFLYQGFLLTFLLGLLPVFVSIIGNIFLFYFLHSIYENSVKTKILLITGGLMFSTLFYFFHNLYLLTVIHAVLNFLAVLGGFFPLRRVSKADNV